MTVPVRRLYIVVSLKMFVDAGGRMNKNEIGDIATKRRAVQRPNTSTKYAGGIRKLKVMHLVFCEC